MSGGRGGGAWSVGCGAFGLLSVLLGTGLAIYLSSRVLDSTSGVLHASTTTAEHGPKVEVTPPGALAEGQVVRLAGTGWAPGKRIEIDQCSHPGAGNPKCGPTVKLAKPVEADGGFAASFTVHRLLQGKDGPVDCASPESGCAIVVTSPDAGTAVRIAVSFGG